VRSGCFSTSAPSKGPSQDSSARQVPFDVGSVDLETPEHVIDGSKQRPRAHPLWGQVEFLSKPIDELVNGRPIQPFRQNVSKEVAGVEGRFAGEWLGVDQEPGLAPGGQDVPEVVVAVRQDRLHRRAREFAAQAHGRSKQGDLEGHAQSVETLG
jgi:hypothetical protein